MTPEQALEICNNKNLRPAFYYETFSSSEDKPKYRLCFIMDQVITDTHTRALIMETLISLFPQSDKSCKNADRIFLGTNKQAVLCDKEATISLDNIINATTPPSEQLHNNEYRNDTSLAELKRDFDFFGYLKERNGKVISNNSYFAKFENCELCGHHKDLVFYHQSKTFKCFGAGCNRDGTIIDYIMISKNMGLKQAIDYFK